MTHPVVRWNPCQTRLRLLPTLLNGRRRAATVYKGASGRTCTVTPNFSAKNPKLFTTQMGPVLSLFSNAQQGEQQQQQAATAEVAAMMVATADKAEAAAAAAAVTHMRVLWDIENVHVPSGIDADEALHALERWLERRGLWGVGINKRIIAFYNPENVTSRMRDALKRANVEQVLAGAKLEDADRQLNARLEEYLELLPTKTTAVVFITADMDFIPQLRRVKERGGPTVLLTTATQGSHHYNALANSATETHLWRDIVCTAPAPPPPLPPPPPWEAAAEKAAAVKAAAEKAAAEKAAAKKAKKRAKKKEMQKEKKKKKNATVGDGGDDDDDDDDDDGDDAPPVFVPVARGSPGPGSSKDPIAPPVRYEAECTYWDGRGGWGKLSVQHGGTLFVHNKALLAGFGPGRRSLRRGDLVSYALGSNHEGPCAVDVQLVKLAPAPPAVLGMKRNDPAGSVRV